MRLLVTGSRNWPRQYKNLISYQMGTLWVDIGKPQEFVLMHGAARGVDCLAAEVIRHWGMVKRLDWSIESYDADWPTYGDEAGPIRNQQMVDARPDVVLAFTTERSFFRTRTGTLDCWKRAQRAGIPGRVIALQGHEALRIYQSKEFDDLERQANLRRIGRRA